MMETRLQEDRHCFFLMLCSTESAMSEYRLAIITGKGQGHLAKKVNVTPRSIV